jgi:hypothetical protein
MVSILEIKCKGSIFIYLYILFFFVNCPIVKKMYILESGDSDLIERKEAQSKLKNSLLVYVSRCKDDKLQGGILTYWDPILKAKPCNKGVLSIDNSSIQYCYEKLFLDKSNIDSCSLLLLSGSCSNWTEEMAITYTFCKKSLILENYSNIIKVL